MEVKISVIMGVYQPRSRQILFQAVLSICSQTFSDWELIMVDDGTHGEGRDWIDQASLLDARIRLIRLPRHKGLSTALNAAIAASRGSYIARMDADDLSAPHRLQRLFDFLGRLTRSMPGQAAAAGLWMRMGHGGMCGCPGSLARGISCRILHISTPR